MRWLIFVLLLTITTSLHAKDYGLISAPPEKYGSIPEAYAPLLGKSVPASVDLSEHLPIPGEQINQSCVGWATAYALKTYQEKIERGWSVVSSGQNNPERVFSPAFIYNQINGGQDKGSFFVDAFKVLASQGAAPLSKMPYTGMPYAPVPAEARQSATPYKIDTFRRVDVSNNNELKNQIAAGFPIVIGSKVFKQFELLGPGQVWNQASGQKLGDHAMLVVGYDDAKNAFKVINSWGTKWGSGGYGWISYDLFPLVVNEGYIVVDLKGVDSQTQPDQDIWTPPTIAPEKSTINITKLNLNYIDPIAGVGLYISGTVTVPQGIKGTARIVLPMNFANGNPVTTLDPVFMLPSGQAATGTPLFPLNGNGVTNVPWYAFIRYCSLNLPMTKYCIPYPSPPYVPVAQSDLTTKPILFIDNFGVAEGQPLNFYVRL